MLTLQSCTVHSPVNSACIIISTHHMSQAFSLHYASMSLHKLTQSQAQVQRPARLQRPRRSPATYQIPPQERLQPEPHSPIRPPMPPSKSSSYLHHPKALWATSHLTQAGPEPAKLHPLDPRPPRHNQRVILRPLRTPKRSHRPRHWHGSELHLSLARMCPAAEMEIRRYWFLLPRITTYHGC